MEINNIIDNKITSSIQETNINGLSWLPYIGNNYQNQSSRLLIIGKSHYNWGGEDADRQLSSEAFNYEAVIWNGLGINRWNNETIPNFKQLKFHRNIERIIFGTSNIYDESFQSKREGFWKSIAFHQLIQKPMADWKHSDNKKDRIKGWNLVFELIPHLKPDNVLFLSNQWKYYKDFMDVAEHQGYSIESSNQVWAKVSKSEVRSIRFSNGNTSFRISMIVHPSSRTSNISEQHSFLNQAIPECLKQYSYQ